MGKSLRIKLYLINFLLGAGLYSSIEVMFLQSRNISSYLISLLILCIPLGTALLEIPTGIIGDFLGRKKIFRLTFVSFFVASMFIFFAPNVIFIFVGYIFEALGYSLYSGNTESIIYEVCKKEGADINRSFSNFYASLTIGYVFSGIFVNALAMQGNNNILEGALIATIIIRLVAVILCYSVTNLKEERNTQKPLGIMKDAITLLMKDKVSTSICIYDAVGRLQYYLPVIYQPILISSGVSIRLIAFIYSLSQLSQSVAQKAASILIEKMGVSIILRVSPIIQGISLLLVLTRNTYLVIIGIIIVFAGISIKGQCTSLVRHSLVSNDIRATYMSVISLCTLLINTVLLNMVGIVLEINTDLAVITLSLVLIILSEFVVKSIVSKAEAIN